MKKIHKTSLLTPFRSFDNFRPVDESPSIQASDQGEPNASMHRPELKKTQGKAAFRSQTYANLPLLLSPPSLKKQKAPEGAFFVSDSKVVYAFLITGSKTRDP